MRVVLEPKVRRRIQIELADNRMDPMLVNGHYTICNHLRLLCKTPLTDQQKELCEEIMYLSKKITKKLKHMIHVSQS